MAIKHVKYNNPDNDHMIHSTYRGMTPIIYHVNEIWKPITIENIQPWYYISNYGRVYSKLTDAIIHQIIIGHGYLKVTLRSLNNTPIDMLVHRLVLITFNFVQNHNILQVNHINCNKLDNRLCNLEWCTNKENIQHAYANNLYNSRQGESNNFAKFTNSDVITICKCLENNMPYKDICNLLSIPYDNTIAARLGLIKRRLTWKHISKDFNF